jgi:hypothetical protein
MFRHKTPNTTTFLGSHSATQMTTAQRCSNQTTHLHNRPANPYSHVPSSMIFPNQQALNSENYNVTRYPISLACVTMTSQSVVVSIRPVP